MPTCRAALRCERSKRSAPSDRKRSCRSSRRSSARDRGRRLRSISAAVDDGRRAMETLRGSFACRPRERSCEVQLTVAALSAAGRAAHAITIVVDRASPWLRLNRRSRGVRGAKQACQRSAQLDRVPVSCERAGRSESQQLMAAIDTRERTWRRDAAERWRSLCFPSCARCASVGYPPRARTSGGVLIARLRSHLGPRLG